MKKICLCHTQYFLPENKVIDSSQLNRSAQKHLAQCYIYMEAMAATSILLHNKTLTQSGILYYTILSVHPFHYLRDILKKCVWCWKAAKMRYINVQTNKHTHTAKLISNKFISLFLFSYLDLTQSGNVQGRRYLNKPLIWGAGTVTRWNHLSTPHHKSQTHIDNGVEVFLQRPVLSNCVSLTFTLP